MQFNFSGESKGSAYENVKAESTKEETEDQPLATIKNDTEYSLLQHNINRPAAEVPSKQSTSAGASLPLLDDYSTITDVLEATSRAGEISVVIKSAPIVHTEPKADSGTSMPVLDDYSTISDVLQAASKTAEISSHATLDYTEVKKSPVSLKRDNGFQENTMPEEEREDDLAEGESMEIPLYSEVNKEVKKSREKLDDNEQNEDNSMPLYSAVNLELKRSRQALDDHEESKEEEQAADSAIPLYSEVNQELKKSREALDTAEEIEGRDEEEPKLKEIL